MANKRLRSGKNGNRKCGRSKEKCIKYRAERKREKNKVRKLVQYARKHPNDKEVYKHIERLRNFINS